jgi:hypothetical protein
MKTKWGKVNVLHTRDADGKIFWQNYPGLLVKDRKPLHSTQHDSLITDQMLDNMVQHTNQYIHITNLTTAASDVFIGLLCLAGMLWNNQQSPEELWGADGDCIKQSRSVTYQRCFKIPIRCILKQTRVVSIKFCTFICRNLEGMSEVPTTNTFILRALTNGGLKN